MPLDQKNVDEFLEARASRAAELRELREVRRERAESPDYRIKRVPGRKRCPRCWSVDIVAENIMGVHLWYQCSKCEFRHGRPRSL